METYIFFFFCLKISHLSTCACLSEKSRYPTFFRTVPSDHFQIRALVQLMKYFDWRWVGVIYSMGTYAAEGSSEFVKKAQKEGICVEYRLLYLKSSISKFRTIVKTLKKSSSKVVLMFMSLSYTKSFLSKMEGHNITGKQWVGSESWITHADLVSADREHILHGAIGYSLPRASIPGLGAFLHSLKPSDESNSTLIKAVWEDFFDCSFTPSNTSTLCTGEEDLKNITSDYTDITNFREENSVYTAVYSVAFALQMLLQCENGLNPSTGKLCLTKEEVTPKLVSYKSIKQHKSHDEGWCFLEGCVCTCIKFVISIYRCLMP